jgi:predicted PurR-regulated permease PerM
VLAVWFGLQLLWTVSSLVFLVFLATLFGLAVGRGVDVLARFRIRRGIASALIVLGTLGAIGGVLAWTAPTLIEQGKQLQTAFPEAVHKLQTWVDSTRSGFVGRLISSAPAASSASTGAGRTTADSTAAPSEAIRQRITTALGGASRYLFSFVSNTLAAATAFVLMVFLAMYIGAEPEVYRGWLLSVVPATSRAEVRLVLSGIATVLRKWLVTQMIAMLVIGTVSMVVLLLLGVKAAFALAFIAGLCEFIPTVGPVLSAVPAILMGFVDSPEKALAVLVAYWGIQFLENNLLIPYLMRGEMDLPPAITLVAQTLMTLLFGFVGLMVAVPLTAAVLVPLRMMAVREDAREQAMRTADAAGTTP